MSKPEQASSSKYWVRSDSGRVWGPYPLETLARINVGTEDPSNIHVSADGRNFEPASSHPDVLERLQQAVSATIAAKRAAIERELRAVPPPPPPPPPPPGPPKVIETPVQDLPGPPPEGALETFSTVNLFARIAAQQLLGKLTIDGPDGRSEVSFKKGTPEHVVVSQPGASLARFLVEHHTLTDKGAARMIEDAGGPDADLLPLVLSLGIVPPHELFPLLGKYAVASLTRVLAVEAGKFTWAAGVAPPPGSFALGDRWSLLCEWCRQLNGRVARRRLGDRTGRAVYRASDPRVNLDTLKLTALEVRVIPFFDGTRSPVQIALEYPGESDMVYRTVLLLGDVGFLSFGPELKRAAGFVDDVPVAMEKVSVGAEAAAPVDGAAVGKVALKSVAVAVPVAAPVAAPVVPPPPAAVVPPPPAPAVIAPPAAIVVPPPPPAIVPPPPSAVTPPAPKAVTPPPRPAPPSAAPRPPVIAPKIATPASPVAAKAPPGKPGAKAPKPIVIGDDLASLRELSEKWKGEKHFDVLGVDRNAPVAAIKEAYFDLARKCHPDTVGESADPAVRQVKADLTARINEAYRVLGDDALRKAYFAELEEGAKVDIGPILQAEEDFLRATIMVKARKFPEAMELLNRAIALSPNELEFLAWRAWSRFAAAKDKKQEYDSAIAECSRVARDNPMCVAAHLFSGQMAKIMGDMGRAEAAFKKVLEIEPNNIEAARELRMARR